MCTYSQLYRRHGGELTPPEPEVNVSISGGILYMNDSIETLKALLSAISLCEVANCQLKMLNFSKNCGNQGLDWVQSQEVALCKNTELHSHMPKPHVMGCGFLIMTGEGEKDSGSAAYGISLAHTRTAGPFAASSDSVLAQFTWCTALTTATCCV